MRILLALAILVAAVLVLLFLLPSRGAPASVEPVAVEPAEPAQRGPVDLVSTDAGPEPGRSTSAETSASQVALDGSRDVCQVEIVAVGKVQPIENRIDIECVDAIGRPVACTAKDAMSWRMPNAEPGEYHVTLRPRGSWNPAGARFVVAPGERMKRVEVPLALLHVLRVRWQTTDGQPIADALRQPGVIEDSALLRVAPGVERLPVRAPAPVWPQSLIDNVRQRPAEVRPAAEDSADHVRSPPWPDAPADAFGVLILPIVPPCAVHACIGGVVVESLDVAPGTSEVVFRTNLDDVRRSRTTLRFCVIAAESGDPVEDANYMINSSGIGHPTVHLGPDGCQVDFRVLPGVWMLTVGARDRASHWREIDLAPGATLDLGTIALKKSCRVRARLRLPDGSPAVGVAAQLLSVNRFGWGHTARGGTVSDGLLTFTVPDERHAIVVQDERWVAASALVEPCGADGVHEEVTLQLETGVKIALDFGPTSPLATQVLVYDAHGLPVARRPIGLTGLVPLRLVPGEYQVVRPDRPGAHEFRVGRDSVVIEVRE